MACPRAVREEHAGNCGDPGRAGEGMAPCQPLRRTVPSSHHQAGPSGERSPGQSLRPLTYFPLSDFHPGLEGGVGVHLGLSPGDSGHLGEPGGQSPK